MGVYEVKWYRRTDSGAEHMVENKVADVNVGDKLDVFCVITGLDKPNNGTVLWQVAVKGYTLTVTKIDLANATVTIDPWLADGKFRFNPHASETAALAFFSVITVTANGEKYTLKENDYTYEGATATRVGKYTLTITATDSCAKFKGSKTFDWEVIPYTLHEQSFLGKQTYTKTYDGTTTLPEYTFRALFPGKGSDLEVDWREDKYKNNYEVTAAEFVSADAGENKPINQTITLKNENFVFAPTEMINIKGITTTDKTITYTNFTPIETYPTLGTTFNIEKADAPAAREGALEVINDRADTYTVDLSALLPKLESPKKYGDVAYALGKDAISFSADGYYKEGTAKIEGGKLILPIQDVKTETAGSIGSVQVKVSTTNYHDFTLIINVNATNKIVPTGEPTLSKTTLAWGEQLSTISLSGAMTDPTDSTKTVKGGFEWVTPETRMETVGDYQAEWRFTPADTAVYAETSGKVKLTVTKATPTGTPKYTAITKEGQTLADANLTAEGENNES